ncbi:TIR domain-containing protein [Sinomonas sp. JGH33]|uniref:TIR domain-containing protein n=1 Tax=Sinomonas terricola TaxID=3110330 RepID=A0ABU5T9X7_9MICC|nr:TIR domain-containing protein [Sinomonas sp. JGH33]MEA5456497.1 TIR domain-containing protein [Sinomonas sp. JGH33]
MAIPADITGPRSGRLVFISYARADRDAADRIRQAVVAMHHEAWIDSNLEGGHEWWNEILDQLRRCDAVIVAVSAELLESEAARAERVYALSLGKPIIPIKVREIRDDLLPPDIAARQYIDFTRPTLTTGIELANVLSGLPPAVALPPELPPAPPLPASYFGGIAEMLHRSTLADDEQRLIAGKLADALQRPREREAALELLAMLENRRDLYASTAREITRIRRDLIPAGSLPPEPVMTPGPTSFPPEARRPDPARPAPQRPAPHTPERRPAQQGPQRPRPEVGATTTGGFPSQHWGLSITGLLVSILSFVPLGVVAVVMSAQVAARWNRGDPAGSANASRLAVVWGWIGIGWGALALLLYLVVGIYAAQNPYGY